MPSEAEVYLAELTAGWKGLACLFAAYHFRPQKKLRWMPLKSLPLINKPIYPYAQPCSAQYPYVHAHTQEYYCTIIVHEKSSKVQSSFALPFQDGIHIHMGAIQIYTSQSVSDFVRYIHMVSLKFTVPTQGTRSVLHIRCRNNLLQIEPSLCPGQLKLLDVVAGEIRVRTFH